MPRCGRISIRSRWAWVWRIFNTGEAWEALDAFSLGCMGSPDSTGLLKRLSGTYRSGPLREVWGKQVYATIEDFEHEPLHLLELWTDTSVEPARISLSSERAFKGTHSVLLEAGEKAANMRRWYFLPAYIPAGEGALGLRCCGHGESVTGKELIAQLWFPEAEAGMTLTSQEAEDARDGWRMLTIAPQAIRDVLAQARERGYDAENCHILKVAIRADALSGKTYWDSFELFLQ